MKGVRQPWMMRAAIGLVLIGAGLIAWTVFVIEVYRGVCAVAPSWLTEPGHRSSSLLDRATLLIWGMIGLPGAVIAWVGLSRLLRIPDDSLTPEGEAKTYPFADRKLSARARRRPGQEGFVDSALERWGRVMQSPLTPPPRDAKTDD